MGEMGQLGVLNCLSILRPFNDPIAERSLAVPRIVDIDS